MRASRCQMLCVLVAVAMTGGCVDSVGLSCPNGAATCDGEDLGVLPDAFVPVDLARVRDLATFDAAEPADLSAVVDAGMGEVDAVLGSDGALTCAETCMGCCDHNGNCLMNGFTSCGLNGATCTTCNQLNADNCEAGTCACGTSATVCPAGQQCLNGDCQCTQAGCPSGCCAGDGTCHIGDFTACGAGGGMCVTCDKFTSDSCVNGSCGCGGATPCPSGDHCVGGKCVCDATSCSNGCCTANNQCITTTSASACGSNGGLCQPCATATICSGGVCVACGTSETFCAGNGGSCVSSCSSCAGAPFACKSNTGTLTCVSSCAACPTGTLGCTTSGSCVTGCNSCGSTFLCSGNNTCVSLCATCMGANFDCPGNTPTCTSSCGVCAGATSTCFNGTIGGRCLATCSTSTCTGTCQ